MADKKFSYAESYKNDSFSDKPKAIVQLVILNLILIAVSAIGLLSLDLFLLGLLLIFAPALFATLMCLIMNQINTDYSNKEFFAACKKYYSFTSPYRGCFDLLKGILWSILVGMAGSCLFALVYPYFGGQAFSDASTELMDLFIQSDFEGVASLIQSNEALNKFYLLDEVISLSFALIFMIFRTGKFVLNVEAKSITALFGPAQSTRLFKDIWKRNRREFNRDFFNQTWYMQLGIIIIYVLGVILSFVLNIPGYCIVIGTTLALIFASICLPSFLFFIEAFLDKHMHIFKDEFRQIINNSLVNLDKNASMNEAQKQSMKQILDELDKVEAEEHKKDEEKNQEQDQPKE